MDRQDPEPPVERKPRQPLSPDEVARRRGNILNRAFSTLPAQLGLVNGGTKSILTALIANPDWVPPQLYPGYERVIAALLAPSAEVPILKSTRQQRVQESGLVRAVRDSATQPRIHGLQNLFPIVQSLLRPNFLSARGGQERGEIEGEADPVLMNLGISADPDLDSELPLDLQVSPAFLAYSTLALERLRELLPVTQNIRLRVFSTASLSNTYKRDPRAVKDTQLVQKELLDAFIERFYPELKDFVETTDITGVVPLLSRHAFKKRRERVWKRLEDPKVFDSLRRSGERHGSRNIQDSVRYAVYHTTPWTFGDGGEYKHVISVGGYSENPFMVLRGFKDPSEQHRLGIAVRGVLARTPPYLQRTGSGEGVPLKGFAPEITMPQFLAADEKRVKAFLKDPFSHRSPYARDLIHLGRVTGGSQRSHANIIGGIASLRDFYREFYSSRT